MKTIFEQIISGEVNSYKLYEDEKFIAILDAFPKQNGHLLIIVKDKKANILQEDSQTINELFLLAKKISTPLMKELNAKGIKWVTNVGKEAGQVIFHTHLHLIPYYDKKNDLIDIKEVYKKLIKKF